MLHVSFKHYILFFCVFLPKIYSSYRSICSFLVYLADAAPYQEQKSKACQRTFTATSGCEL